MPDENLGAQQPDNGKKEAPPPAPSTGGRNSTVKVLILIVILAVALFAAHRSGLLPPLIGSHGSSESAEDLAPVLNRLSPDNSISSAGLLADIGRSPVDPSKVLFPAFEKSVLPDADKKPLSSPTGSMMSAGQPSAPDSGSPSAPGASRATAAKALETPVIVSRGPADAVTQEKPARKKKRAEAKAREATPERDKGDTAAAKPGEDSPPTPQAPEQAKVEDSGARQKEPPAAAAPQAKLQEPSDQAKPEQFQLPGSLLVKVQNYSGTFAKWGVMVILDDSEAMARKSKAWEPNKIGAAVTLVGKLPGVLTQGSKLAVRDFLCSKPDGSKKAATAPCPSHVLFDWADHPFKGLKEKLSSVNPGGHTNVCAAAAYAFKKDLAGLKDLAPRLLLVTSGSGKCTVKEVLHALDQRGGQVAVPLDVVAFAMAKKREGTYSALAKKGHGLFLRVEKPADVDEAVARYGKALKTKVLEKIEVKGEKAVFNPALEEEITLPPGSYTITLPLVAGLTASKRVIPNIRISSGEAKVLEVQVKKGKPVVRVGKK